MKKSTIVFSLLTFIAFAGSLLLWSTPAQATTHEVDGYAWSSNIGWISFNCKTGGANQANVCIANGGASDYKVLLDDTTGKLSGYAWSTNIGWISFNEAHIVGCPAGGANCTTPSINLTDGAITGWARACAGTVNGDCTGASRTDGWDGWIELSGTNHTSPDLTGAGGVSYKKLTGEIVGYAWGSNVVGWIQFRTTTTGVLPGSYQIVRVDGTNTPFPNPDPLGNTSQFNRDPSTDSSLATGAIVQKAPGNYKAGVTNNTPPEYELEAGTCVGAGCIPSTWNAPVTVGGMREYDFTITSAQLTRIVFRYSLKAELLFQAKPAGDPDTSYGTDIGITPDDQLTLHWNIKNVNSCRTTATDDPTWNTAVPPATNAKNSADGDHTETIGPYSTRNIGDVLTFTLTCTTANASTISGVIKVTIGSGPRSITCGAYEDTPVTHVANMAKATTSVAIGTKIWWVALPSPNVLGYTYTWTGTDLAQQGPTVDLDRISTTYRTIGRKTANVQIGPSNRTCNAEIISKLDPTYIEF
jgi:hypothetical protein